MEDGDAEFAILVDVGMVEWAGELELGWGVRVVGGKLHVGKEVTAIIEGVGVDDDEGDGPVEYVVVLQLSESSQHRSLPVSLRLTYFNVDPFLL